MTNNGEPVARVILVGDPAGGRFGFLPDGSPLWLTSTPLGCATVDADGRSK